MFCNNKSVPSMTCSRVQDHPAVLEELDIVEEAEQFTHMLPLEEAVSTEDMLSKLLTH